MSDPNGELGHIIDNGKVAVLKEYPTCGNDGNCDCSLLTHNRALYDVNLFGIKSRWIYMCEDCWNMYVYYDRVDGSLGLGKAQRIVVTVGSLPLIRTLKDQRRCDEE